MSVPINRHHLFIDNTVYLRLQAHKKGARQPLAGIIEDLLDDYDKQSDTVARLAEENQKQRREIEVLEATIIVYRDKEAL